MNAGSRTPDRNPHRLLGRPAAKLTAGAGHRDRARRRPRRRHGAGRGTAGLVRGAALAASRGRAAAAGHARRTLRRARAGQAASAVPWREVFVGGGVAAVAAAVMAGWAWPRWRPHAAVRRRRRRPTAAARMPRLPVLLHARQERPPQQALAALSAAFQGAIRGWCLFRRYARTQAARHSADAAVLAPARFTLTVSSQHTTRFIHEHRYAQDPPLRFRQRPCAPRHPNA